MNSKLSHLSFLTIVITLGAFAAAGCGGVTPVPTPTSTQVPTRTPVPTVTRTPTMEPSPTPALMPVPTSSVNDPAAVSLTDECRSVMDGLYELKKDLHAPDHFTTGEPFRLDSDFNPNDYFRVLTHLQAAPGYQLDYIYFGDELGGKPVMYARKAGAAPFKSYEEFLQSFGEELSGERSYTAMNHAYDYLDQIKVDQSPESYFQFITLALFGDQFYLFWHGLYNDTKILCDTGDLQHVEADLQDFELDLPPEVVNKVDSIDFTPVVLVGEDTVTVRFVSFSKWGGFFENVFVLSGEEGSVKLIDSQWNPLIEYDCGIAF